MLAQERTPVSSITSATLEQYRNEYGQSAVCSSNEITLWRCETRQRAFALCSSPVATRTTGYLQYRASDAGKVTFTYPETKRPPIGLFEYNAYSNGDASVQFSNKGYHYSLIDPLREASAILVTGPGSAAKTTRIACGPNQTLQVNYTLRLMHDAGLWKDN